MFGTRISHIVSGETGCLAFFFSIFVSMIMCCVLAVLLLARLTEDGIAARHCYRSGFIMSKPHIEESDYMSSCFTTSVIAVYL